MLHTDRPFATTRFASTAVAFAVAAAFGVAACSASPSPPAVSASLSSAASSGAPDTGPATASRAPRATASSQGVVGTVVRFSSGGTSVDVTLDTDNPTVRDLLRQLPLTLSLEDYNEIEKVSYLPRRLATAGSPGSDPENGDLSYYAPWGNLVFYYDEAVGFSDQTIHLGRYGATPEQLAQLEGDSVRVEVVG